jgi:hypothetical protein
MSDDYSEIGETTPTARLQRLPPQQLVRGRNRIAGVTTVVSSPTGRHAPGQASIMDLAGATVDEMEIARRGALIVDYPKVLDFEPGAYQRVRRRISTAVRRRCASRS